MESIVAQKMPDGKFILGLDLGKSSIGWAVVDCDDALAPVAVRAMNSRIFQEMVDEDGVPKNKKRRQMRGTRRQNAQYKRRRRQLMALLQSSDLLPKAEYNEKTANRIDRCFAARVTKKPFGAQWAPADKIQASPYKMRAYGLDNALEREEFGRVLMNLQRRRGYFSNRGAKYLALRKHLGVAEDNLKKAAEEGKKDKDIRPVLKGIGELEKRMNADNARTVGEYVWHRASASGRPAERISKHGAEQEDGAENGATRGNFYTTRGRVREEFDLLWKKQAECLKLGAKLKERVEFLLFYQTPLEQSFQAKNKKEASWLGLRKFTPRRKPARATCIFEPQKKRAAKAVLAHQEARTRQAINDLKFQGEPLTDEQRKTVYQRVTDIKNLNQNGRLSWAKVAKILGGAEENINFSRAGDSEGDPKHGLVGNRTARAICRVAGKEFWSNLSNRKKEKLVTDLLTIKDKKALYKRLSGQWKLPEGQGEAAHVLAETEFETGHSKHSLLVWKKLLPHLRRGENYHNACIKAGYDPDQKKKTEVREIKPADVPQIANPIVQKALYEVRHVVNGIIRRYGFPVEIRVELARDMAKSKKHRKEIEEAQKQNRKRNADAEDKIRPHIGKISDLDYRRLPSGLKMVRSADRKKYIMWHYEQNCRCPYCFECIGIADLFGGGAEIEHILPQAGFGQNYMNTVVACRSCNSDKGGESPYQAWGGTEKWEGICGRISNDKRKHRGDKFPALPFAKKARIRDEKFAPADGDARDFVERDLKNTQYIAVAAKDMLQACGIDVQVSNGGATAELRKQWGLNKLLPWRQEDGSYKENDDELIYDEERAANVKNRKDHRHHAVDALVVALTDHKTLMRLTKHYQRSRDLAAGQQTTKQKLREQFPLPGRLQENREGFIGRIRDVLQPVVSHMRKDKVHGALHEESFYGAGVYYTTLEIKAPVSRMVGKIRKLVETAADAQGDAAWIEDDAVRASLKEWLEKGDYKKPPVDKRGKTIGRITVANRCYVKRLPIEKALKYVLKSPGSERWVIDDSLRDILQNWWADAGGESGKPIKQRLQEFPPRMPGGRGEGNEIKKVRVAYKKRGGIHALGPKKAVPLGSYHHVEIFKNEKGARKGRFVSMLEAARRLACREPLVNKQPDESGWAFEMDLRKNDMVRLEGDVKNISFSSEPIYRVQMLEATSSRIVFRHHSVAATDGNYGKEQRTINQIKCRKVRVDELGNVLDDGG